MLGYFYFIQNDESVPYKVRELNRKIGLDKTMYTDNNNIPYEIYVREARRTRGRYIFNENDATLAPGLTRSPIHGDSVAIAEWPMDSHDCTTDIRPGSLHDGVILLTEKTRPSQVPYRSLLPKILENLLVPICLSATHVGIGTLRVEPTWMHICESAAHASIIAVREGVPLSKVNVEYLQSRLVATGIMLSFFNEWTSQDEDWWDAVQFLGTKGFFSSYDLRPLEPVTTKVASVWIKGIKAFLNQSLNPGYLARLIADADQTESDPITYSKFDGLLQEANLDCKFEKGEELLIRSRACLHIYDYLKLQLN